MFHPQTLTDTRDDLMVITLSERPLSNTELISLEDGGVEIVEKSGNTGVTSDNTAATTDSSRQVVISF